MPSKRQVSLTLSAPADRAVKKRMTPANRNKSRIVSQIIERYIGLMRYTTPKLEDDELEHLARLVEGWRLDFSVALSLPKIVAAADVPEDLNVRKRALVVKLEDAGAVGRVALIERLEARGGE